MAKDNGSAIGSMFEILAMIVVGYLALRLLPGLLSGFAGSVAGVNGSVASGQGVGNNPFALGYNSKTGFTASTTGNTTTLLTSIIGALKGNRAPSAPLPTMVPQSGGGSPLAGMGNSLGSELLSLLGHGPLSGVDAFASAGNAAALGDASLYFNAGQADQSIANQTISPSPVDTTQLFDTSQLAYNAPSSGLSDPSSVDPSSGLDLSSFSSGSFDPNAFGSGGGSSFDGGGYSFG